MPASTVTEYLAALPADHREALNELRRGITRALPPGYKEGIQFGESLARMGLDMRTPFGFVNHAGARRWKPHLIPVVFHAHLIV